MGGSTLSATTPAATEAKHTFLKLQDAASSPKAPVCMHFLIMACSLFTHAGKKNRNVVVIKSILFQLNVRHKTVS